MVIRRVCLDAFGTVFSPRTPVFDQYASVARSYGLSVDGGKVKDGFKRAFKQWLKTHPLYGKHSSPPLEPTAWWAGVIGDTFRFAGVSQQELAPVEDNLANSLVQRFWGEEGYSLHSEFPAFLDSLRSLGIPPPSIVSNTDPALVRILDNLGVSERRIGAKGILKEEIFTTWALEKEKQEVGFWHDVLKKLDETSGKGERLKPEEVLVVGDELIADYETPRQAGMQSLLLRRLKPGEGHANPSYLDEQNGQKPDVQAVRNLSEVIEWIKKENGRIK
ncbi:hypothetical protein JCM5353_001959 [Sporobolomyces roseus]